MRFTVTSSVGVSGIDSSGFGENRLARMDEAAVFGHVVDELETRGYEPLVHVPRSSGHVFGRAGAV